MSDLFEIIVNVDRAVEFAIPETAEQTEAQRQKTVRRQFIWGWVITGAIFFGLLIFERSSEPNHRSSQAAAEAEASAAPEHYNPWSKD
jgi:hypothetical protein